MNCKDCQQDCQKIGCDIELECSGYVEPSNGTKERMDERLAMMHRLYPESEEKHTNADRVRAMTDEEIAWWLITGCDGKTCPDYAVEYREDHDDASEGCRMCWLEWLKQEYEA